MSPDVRAALIGATFGLGYVLGNAGALARSDTVLLDITAVVVYIALVLLLVRHRRRAATSSAVSDRQTFGRRYWLVVLAEVVVGVVGLALVPSLIDGRRAALAWVTLVVGLHFFGLGAVWHRRVYHLLGALLSLCGIAGLVLSATGADGARVAVTAGVLPGALLLASSYRVLRPTRRRQAADR